MDRQQLYKILKFSRKEKKNTSTIKFNNIFIKK